MKNTLKKIIVWVSISILPLTLLILSLHYSTFSGPYGSDPEYIYLFNGICIGRLQVSDCHVDHPGTPIQVVAAITSRITHLFTGKSDYASDVLTYPDKYLRILNKFLILLITVLGVFVSYKTYKITNNVLVSILILSAPLFQISVFTDLNRVMPDVFSIYSYLALSYLLIKYYYDLDSSYNLKRYAVLMGIVCGFGIAVKLSIFTYAIIPLIVLPGRKAKLQFISITIISFFLFAFTTLFKLNYFFNWITNMFIHTEHYGRGPTGIIDLSKFNEHFNSIITRYKSIKLVFPLLTLSLLIQLISSKLRDQKLLLILSGIFISIVIHTFLVIKHFNFNYMIPIIFLFPLTLYFAIESLLKSFGLIKNLIYILIISTVLITFTDSFIKMRKWKSKFSETKSEVVQNIREVIGNHKLILIPRPFSLYFKEQGTIFGVMHTGKHRKEYTLLLKKTQPNVFLSDTRDGFFYAGDWAENRKIIEINDSAYVFFNKEQLERKEHFFGLLGDSLSADVIYTHPHLDDCLYIVRRYK